MPAVKNPAQVAEKWARVTPGRSEDYKLGVQNPRTSWSQAASAAQERYKQAVVEAANAGRYQKSIQAVGDQKWQQKALAKGPTRFAEGVQVSAPDFQAGIAPYLETIAATTLPPRFAKGDPRNIERVRVMSQALRKRKTG
jgi:hypothetical protein